MRNLFSKFAQAAGFALALTFTLSCTSATGGGGGGGDPDSINGTWKASNGETITLDNGIFTVSKNNMQGYRGTYTSTSNNITLTTTEMHGDVLNVAFNKKGITFKSQWYNKNQFIEALKTAGLSDSQIETILDSMAEGFNEIYSGTIDGNTMTVDGTAYTKAGGTGGTPSSSGSSSPSGGSDIGTCIDGTVAIGTQTWQKCNLNVDPGTGKSACYKDDPANCAKYGRLYDWATAMGIDAKYNKEVWGGSDVKHRGLCPSGWHIPSDKEWDTLEDFVEKDKGCTFCAGKYLKAQSGWKGNGTDDYGFAALPGGHYDSEDGKFYDLGYHGNWWGSTEFGSGHADYATGRDMYGDGGSGAPLDDYLGGGQTSWENKNDLYSVRCLKD